MNSAVPAGLIADYDQWKAQSRAILESFAEQCREHRAGGAREIDIITAMTVHFRQMTGKHRLPPEDECQELAQLLAAATWMLADGQDRGARAS